nr:hypothetical protein [Escherichia coli]
MKPVKVTVAGAFVLAADSRGRTLSILSLLLLNSKAAYRFRKSSTIEEAADRFINTDSARQWSRACSAQREGCGARPR